MDQGWFSEMGLGSAKEPEAGDQGSGPLACQSDQDLLAKFTPCGPIIPFSKHCLHTY